MKKFLNLFIIIIIAGLSGVLASQFLPPYLAHTSPFDKISWLKNNGNGTTIINKSEQIVVVEETAIENAIAQDSPKVVGVSAKSKASSSKSSQAGFYGTGFIITSDGWILTDSASLTDKNYDFSIIRDGQVLPAAIVKKDSAAGLVLLKINQTNLPVVSFADFDSLRLGQRIMLTAVDASISPVLRFVELGIIRSLGDKSFNINIKKEDLKSSGAPLINVKGEVVGMAQISADGAIKIVPAQVIKDFLGK
jgi:S1-C subfamily serine protease